MTSVINLDSEVVMDFHDSGFMSCRKMSSKQTSIMYFDAWKEVLKNFAMAWYAALILENYPEMLSLRQKLAHIKNLNLENYISKSFCSPYLKFYLS